MFDAFQNVLFGKKKSSAEAEKASDEFVMIGPPQTEPAPQTIPTDHLFPKLPFGPSFLPEDPPRAPPIMPLQDVPFAINPALHASAKLDQIWRVIAQSLASVGGSPYEEDYDFTLEKSVIAETTNK